jgi:hypothetical protein
MIFDRFEHTTDMWDVEARDITDLFWEVVSLLACEPVDVIFEHPTYMKMCDIVEYYPEFCVCFGEHKIVCEDVTSLFHNVRVYMQQNSLQDNEYFTQLVGAIDKMESELYGVGSIEHLMSNMGVA